MRDTRPDVGRPSVMATAFPARVLLVLLAALAGVAPPGAVSGWWPFASDVCPMTPAANSAKALVRSCVAPHMYTVQALRVWLMHR